MKNPPTPEEIERDLAFAMDIAEEAGERVVKLRATGRWEGKTKADIGDQAADGYLQGYLRGRCPEDGILSEETGDTTARLEKGRVWIVDPIDGTRAFMRGDDTFCHALAIADKGVIVAAVAYFPIKDEMYWATKGGGAFHQGDAIRVAETVDLDGASALAGQPQMNPDRWPGGPPPVKREFRNSLVYRHCLVAEGSFDMAFTFRPAWEWDVAAGELIAEEAGAAISTQHGERWSYNAPHPRMPGVVIAPPVLHSALLKRL